MANKIKSSLGITNMNGITADDDRTCALQDMNCLDTQEPKEYSITDMNAAGKDDDITCALQDMNCIGDDQ